MKNAVVIALLIGSLAANGFLWYRQMESAEGEEHELAEKMSYMQRYSQKLFLAVDAQNHDLAGFYLHELKETAESIEKHFPLYEENKIADLMSTMLTPQLAAMEQAIQGNDWNRGKVLVQSMTAACNSCHMAAQRPYIHIDALATNPFNQSFEKQSLANLSPGS